jgi:hypothetical protein
MHVIIDDWNSRTIINARVIDIHTKTHKNNWSALTEKPFKPYASENFPQGSNKISSGPLIFMQITTELFKPPILICTIPSLLKTKIESKFPR